MEHLGQFISSHWQLWLAFIVILTLILINELMTQKKKAKALSPQTMVDMINNENAIVVDIRDKESYKNGHIIDSINCNAEDFEQPKMNKYKNKNIILVCARGLQSSSVAAKIRSQGFQPLILDGGIAAWQASDLPLVK
jgi:rhodanese-related sulfurtransferase